MPDRNTNVALLLAGVEAVEATDPGLTIAANAIQILEPLEPNLDYAFKHARDKVLAGAALQVLSPLPPKGLEGTWSNTLHARGARNGLAFSGTNLPELDPFLQSAGFAGVVVTTPGSETVTYKPAATSLKSHAENYFVDGRLYKILGAKSEMSWAFDAGGPLVFTVKRTGLGVLGSDQAVPVVTGSPWGTCIPPVAESVGLTINGYANAIVRKAAGAVGNPIARRPNANAAGGLSPHKIRGWRKGTFSVTIEDELGATFNPEAARAAATIVQLTYTIGTTPYNRIQITQNVVIEDVKRGDDNGTAICVLSGTVTDSAPGLNDAHQIVFK